MGGAFCFCTGGVFQHCVVFDTVFGQLLTDATVGGGGVFRYCVFSRPKSLDAE